MVDILNVVDRQLAGRWAGELVAEFGGLGAVLSASDERVASVIRDKRAANLIRALRSALIEATASDLRDRPVLSRWTELERYLVLRLAHRVHENAHILYLNTANVLIRDELMSRGGLDQTSFFVREVARRALELGAAAVILVHNHPSGDPSPSQQDIRLTRDTVVALKPLGVRVHDHIVIAGAGYVSLRNQGLM